MVLTTPLLLQVFFYLICFALERLSVYHTSMTSWAWDKFQKERHLKLRIEKPWHHIIKHLRTTSRKREIPFDLTYEWAQERWTGNCELSGLPFEIGRSAIGTFSPSVDKIDPNGGYLQANCRFILWGLNALKQKENDTAVLKICNAVSSRSLGGT